jgi:hypothetical protein
MIDTTVMTQNTKKTHKNTKNANAFFYNIAKNPEKEIFAF